MSHASPKQTAVLPAHRVEGKTTTQESMSGVGRQRAGQQTVFARLQSLFPSTSPRISTAPLPVEPAPATPSIPHRYLKIRIVSWNMHDSLPKGNLEDLLGTVTPYVPCPENEIDKLHIPNLSSDDEHPYHIVVVASQECPTISGIPMGLGASFRPKEKDKTKDDKGAKKKKGKENDRDDDNEPDGPSQINPPLTPNGDSQLMVNSHGATSGWSWILEEWYCHGLGERKHGAGTSSASALYDSQAASASANEYRQSVQGNSEVDRQNVENCISGNEKKKDGQKSKNCCKDRPRVGPYELLAKERLMGIYVAIFIYRDIKPLIRGCSKSSVTAGLIGGRVGNKGGVGISLNVDGTTLLFINAHLAAHEDREMTRVANFAKIKSELQVNDFLSQDDPRVMSEDLTDKFDYTFLFGDLNFRLDVTRKHADWLISRQQYDEALYFDQLRRLIEKGKAFVGFNEASINFPPTFKYDVKKAVRRDKPGITKELARARSSRRWLGHRSIQNLSEVQETEAELSPPLIFEEREDSLDAEEDNVSFASTAITATSMQSRGGNGDSGGSDGFYMRPSSPRLSNQDKSGDTAIKDTTAAGKLFIAKAALKAKAKWVALVRPKAHSQPLERRISKTSQRSSFSASFPQLKSRASNSENTPPTFRAAASAIELGRPKAESIHELRRKVSKRSVRSSKSANVSGNAKLAESSKRESNAGVYDTSSKQRVPSWCDRIMWKTTVKPEPESEDEDEAVIPDQRNGGLGPRVLAFLTSALRPLAPRARTTSLTSLPSLSTMDTPQHLPEKDLLHPETVRSDSQPLVRQASMGSEKEPPLFKIKYLANTVNVRKLPHRKARNPKLLKSRSIEPTSTTPLVPPGILKCRGRAFTAMPEISAPMVTHPQESGPLVPGTTDPEALPALSNDRVSRQRTTSARGWLRLPFFSRETEVERLASTLTYGLPQEQEVNPSKTRKPRRGEVVALNYNSLDDQAMRQLEGRSDHRPVIGSYIIYI